MQLESALDQLLDRYVSKIQVRPGNGLTRSMNTSLRSYPEIPRIIARTVDCLATLEYLFGLDGTVSVKCSDLYRILINAHEDWFLEMPQVIQAANTVTFTRKPRFPRHQFAAAWAIARQIHLLTGHGALRLHIEALNEFRQLIQAPDTQHRGPPEGWHDKV